MSTPCFIAAAAVTLVAGVAPPQKFEVQTLPGLKGPLPSRMFTGFVDVGAPPSGIGTMYMHYVMFESETDPANAPTVFWYNGGPGASSLYGLFTELGPLYLNDDSKLTDSYKKTGIPTPVRNPWTWTKRFNVFAIDSPAPVGFSYCTQFGPSGNGTSCGPWKDTAVFEANRKVVTAILTDIFPELRKNNLFITGESYAGVYIPGLISALLNSSESRGLNLKGYAIGDGCMGHSVVCWGLDTSPFVYPGTWPGPYYDVQFFAGHGQVSNQLFNRIRRECPENEMRFWNTTSPTCQGYVKKLQAQLGGYYVYNLYDTCPPSSLESSRHGLHKTAARRKLLARKLKGATNEYACPENVLTEWFNSPGVLEALGIPRDSNFFNADDGRGFHYTSDVADVRPFHAQAFKAGLRILTYEGDADASGLGSYGIQDVYVDFWPTIGAARTQSWRPWTLDGNKYMGGYAMEWNQRQVSHLTVRGSGHLVPENKPEPAFSFINRFIFNEEYPHFAP